MLLAIRSALPLRSSMCIIKEFINITLAIVAHTVANEINPDAGEKIKEKTHCVATVGSFTT